MLPFFHERYVVAKYTKEDAARDTGSSTSEVSKSWHKARDDAASSGHLTERNESKVGDSEHGSVIHEFFKSIGLVK